MSDFTIIVSETSPSEIIQVKVEGPQGATGATGPGVPVGGSTGQALVKVSGTNYDTQWSTLAGAWGAITGTLSNQTDLQTALNGKQATGSYLTALTGDVTASGPGSAAATVAKLQGYTVDLSTPPTNNQYLRYSTGTNTWTAQTGGGAADWGTIGGTLSDQTDLQAALDAKLDIVASPLFEPDNTGYEQWHRIYGTVEPLQNSPNAGFDLTTRSLEFDPNSTGFDIGTAGDAGYIEKLYLKHFGTSETGRIGMSQWNFDIGNGTDPITVKGIGYQFGFGQVAAGVTIQDYVQGYGFQPNLNAATVHNGYTSAFYDSANFGCAVNAYQSFNASPTIASVNNNNSYSSFNANPQITTLTGNAGAFGVSISGIIGTVSATGGYSGININPTVTLNKSYVSGFNVNLDNVTNYAGLQSSVTVQDLFFEFYQSFDNDNYTIEFVDDTTAGNESVSISGTDVTVHIESGVSTATQVKAAADATFGFNAAVQTTITGVGSNPQVAAGPVNFAGGENPGTKECYIKGNLRIDGGLSFTGGLSVGALNAFASLAMVNGSGTPVSIHSLITNPTVAANATVTLADTLGVNTAMLLSIGDNATVTTGFLGVQALGLPAVVTMGAGSTVDVVGGAVFALSLDAAAGGGTIDTLNLCSALAIPNGITTVNKSRGYFFDMPFGDVGTDIWGLYSKPASAHNYIAGDLVVGTADLPTNSSVGIEIVSTTKALLLSRMTSAQEAALTAVNGLVIYNTDTNKFRGYENGAWVNLV